MRAWTTLRALGRGGDRAAGGGKAAGAGFAGRAGAAGAAVLVWLALLVFGLQPARAQGSDPQQLEEGARLFAENCAVCHGEQGQGRVGANLSKDWPSIRPDLDIRNIIANGVPGTVMPPWSQARGGPLSDEQIDALTAHILSWGTPGAVIVTRPPATARPVISPVPDVEGDPNEGALLFGENCQVCHGPQGEGRIGAALGKDWPSVRPDLTIHATISNGVPGTVMPAWSQANGGPLSDEQVNHLTAFVMTLPVRVTSGGQPTPSSGPELSWMSGWGGLAVFVLLSGLVLALILIVQRRPA